MKASKIYELAITAVIEDHVLEMNEKIAVLKKLFEDRDLALFCEENKK